MREPAEKQPAGCGGAPGDLSVVVPVYNEVENVGPLHRQIVEALEPTGRAFELVFVDDGSDDGTLAELLRIQRQDSRVRVVELRRNFGQTAAMRAGIERARGSIIVTMDGDLQNDPRDIPRLVSKIDEGYDLVTGWRRRRQDAWLWRTFPSRVANWLIAHVTRVAVHDNGCSLKAYRAELIKQVPLYSELHRFIPAMSTTAGASIAEIVVRHHPRRAGRSKYGLSRIGKVLLDVLAVKMLISCAQRPLYWFGGLALLFGAVALLLALVCIGSWTLGRSAAGSVVFPTALFLFSYLAAQSVFTGLLAELVIRDKGPYHVRPFAAIKRTGGRAS